MVLALLLGNVQLANASSGDQGRVASVSSSAAMQATDPNVLAKELALAMGVPETDIIAADLMGSNITRRDRVDKHSDYHRDNHAGARWLSGTGSNLCRARHRQAADASLANDEEDHQFELDGSTTARVTIWFAFICS